MNDPMGFHCCLPTYLSAGAAALLELWVVDDLDDVRMVKRVTSRWPMVRVEWTREITSIADE